MTLSKGSHLFALGMKGWIEIRMGRVLPKAHTTSTQKLIQETHRQLDDWGNYVYRTVPRKIVLKMTEWTGGKVVGSLRAERFRRLTGLPAINGKVVVVPEKWAQALMKEVGNGE